MQSIMVFLKSCEQLCYLSSNQKKNSGKVLDFGPGFTSKSPDKSNKYLTQNVATTIRLAEMSLVYIFDLNIK